MWDSLQNLSKASLSEIGKLAQDVLQDASEDELTHDLQEDFDVGEMLAAEELVPAQAQALIQELERQLYAAEAEQEDLRERVSEERRLRQVAEARASMPQQTGSQVQEAVTQLQAAHEATLRRTRAVYEREVEMLQARLQGKEVHNLQEAAVLQAAEAEQLLGEARSETAMAEAKARQEEERARAWKRQVVEEGEARLQRALEAMQEQHDDETASLLQEADELRARGVAAVEGQRVAEELLEGCKRRLEDAREETLRAKEVARARHEEADRLKAQTAERDTQATQVLQEAVAHAERLGQERDEGEERLLQALAHCAELQALNAELMDGRQAQEASSSQASSSLAQAQAESSQRGAMLDKLRDMNRQQLAQAQALADAKEALEQRLKTSEANVVLLKRKFQELRLANNQLHKENTKLAALGQPEMAQAQRDSADVEIEELQAEIGSLQTRQGELLAEKESLEAQCDTLRTERDEQHTQCDALKTQVEEEQAQRETLVMQVQTVQALLEEKEGRLQARCDRTEVLEADLARHMAELQQVRDSLRVAAEETGSREEVEALEEEMQGLVAEVKLLESEKQSLQERFGGQEQAMAALKEQHAQDLRMTREEASQALGRAAGSGFANVLVDSHKDDDHALQHALQHGDALDHLALGASAAASHASETAAYLEAEINTLQQQVADLKAEASNAKQALQGAQKRLSTATQRELKSKMEAAGKERSLQAKVAALQAVIDQRQLDGMHSHAEEAETKVQQLQAALQDAEVKWREAEAMHSTDELQDMRSQLAAMRDREATHEEKAAEARDIAADHKQQLEELGQGSRGLRQQLAESLAAVEEEKRRAAQLQQEADDAVQEANSAQEQAIKAVMASSALKKQLEDVQDRHRNDAEAAAILQARCQKAETEADESRQLLQEALAQQQQLVAQALEAGESSQQAMQQAKELQNSLQAAKVDNEQLASSLQAALLQATDAAALVQSLHEQVHSAKMEESDLAEAQDRAKELQRRCVELEQLQSRLKEEAEGKEEALRAQLLLMAQQSVPKEELDRQKQQLADELHKAKATAQQRALEASTAKAQVQASHELYAQVHEQLQQLQAANVQMDVEEAARSQEEVLQAKREVEEVRSEAAASQMVAEEAKEKLEEVSQELEKANKDLDRLRGHLIDTEDTHAAQLLAYVTQADDAARELEVAQEQLREAQANVSQQSQQGEEAVRLREKVERLEAECQAKDAALDSLEMVLETNMRAQQSQLSSELAVARARLLEVDAELQAGREAQKELQVCKASLDVANTELRQTLELLGQCSRDLQHSQAEVSPVRQALDEATRQLSSLTSNEQNLVDRRVVAKLVVTYFTQKRRTDVLELMSRILCFSEEQKKAVGLVKSEGSAWGYIPFFGSSGPQAKEKVEGRSSGGIADLWVEFLLKEAEKRDQDAKEAEEADEEETETPQP